MASNELVLAKRPDVEGLPGAEGLSNHAVIQLGVIPSSGTKTFSETVTISHSATWPPQINLSIIPDPLMPWLPTLTITRVPHVPGAPTSPFPMGPLPVPIMMPAVIVTPPVLPAPYNYFLAPVSDLLVPGISAAHFAAQGPNGIAHFSSPGSVHTLIIAGQTAPGTPPGMYKYSIRVLGGPFYSGPTTPTSPPKPIGKIDLALVVTQV